MPETIEVLLVEDDPEDVELTLEMLKHTPLPIHLSVARDGIEAMAHLRKKIVSSEVLRPDFILLDLNMPRKGGREVLRDIKGDIELKNIPVIIYTTSSNEKEIERCRSMGAALFVTKPVGLKEFKETAKIIEDFMKSSAPKL